LLLPPILYLLISNVLPNHFFETHKYIPDTLWQTIANDLDVAAVDVLYLVSLVIDDAEAGYTRSRIYPEYDHQSSTS
jgi:hypothetical protein